MPPGSSWSPPPLVFQARSSLPHCRSPTPSCPAPGYWLPVQDIRIGSGISLALPRILLTKGGAGAGLGALCVSRMGDGYRKGPRASKNPLLTRVRFIGCLCFQESSRGRPYRGHGWFGTSCKVSTHGQVPLRPLGEQRLGSGGRQSHQVQQQGLQVPLLPGLKSIRFSLRPSPPQAEPGGPDRRTESPGMSA